MLSVNVKLMVALPDENTALNDCFRDKKDWRACKDEVSAAGGKALRPGCTYRDSATLNTQKHDESQESDVDDLPPDGSVQAVLEEAGQR